MTASRAACEWTGEIQLFTLCTIGDPPPFNMLDEIPAYEEKPLAKGRDNPRDWWTITITGIEVIRNNPGPLSSLTYEQIIANAGRRRNSALRARIGWGTTGLGHEIDFDIGSGIRIGIESCLADVRIVGPANRTKEVTKDNPATLGEVGVGGSYADTIITCHMTPTHGPPSARCPTLTQVFSIAIGVSGRSTPIPPFARHITITRTITDPFPGIAPFSFTVGLLGPSVRDFGFQLLDPGTTARVNIPQVATHINFGAAAGVVRTVTLTWELDL